MRLEALAASHRHRAEAGAADQASRLSFDASTEGERLRRFQTSCGRSLLRTLDTLLKLRRSTDAPPPLPDLAEPTDHGPSEPVVETSIPLGLYDCRVNDRPTPEPAIVTESPTPIVTPAAPNPTLPSSDTRREPAGSDESQLPGNEPTARSSDPRIRRNEPTAESTHHRNGRNEPMALRGLQLGRAISRSGPDADKRIPANQERRCLAGDRRLNAERAEASMS